MLAEGQGSGQDEGGMGGYRLWVRGLDLCGTP